LSESSLPFLFGFLSNLWLKTDAGHVMGRTKNGEASNGVTYPDVAPFSVLKGNRRIKNFVARSGPGKPSGSGLKRVKD
jgi:hypothetical protein